MKGLAKLKEEEIREFLKIISNSTDALHYQKILSNMFKALSKEQKSNLEKLRENPKKYMVIIENINKFTDILLEEMRGINQWIESKLLKKLMNF